MLSETTCQDVLLLDPVVMPCSLMEHSMMPSVCTSVSCGSSVHSSVSFTNMSQLRLIYMSKDKQFNAAASALLSVQSTQDTLPCCRCKLRLKICLYISMLLFLFC